MKYRRSNWQIVVSGILIFAVWFGALPVYAQTKQDGKGVGVKVVSELPSKEKRWALIVGIDKYQNDVSSLKGSVNDAKALKNVLVNNAGFPENQIILLTTDSFEQDKRPTRENILGALSDLYLRVPEDGLFLFSFSGHGISVGNQAFLIPSNGRFTKNPELLQDFSIDVTRIKRAIETMKVKQVLMLLDACRNEPGRGDTPNNLTNTLAQGFSFDVANSDVKAFATLYATSVGERAYEFYDKDTKQFRGYFSHAVEEALKGKAANEKGEVTLSRLIDHLETTVPKKVKYDKGETQIPTANYSETYRANQLILAVAKPNNSDVAVQQPKPSPSPIVSMNTTGSNNKYDKDDSPNITTYTQTNLEIPQNPKVGDRFKNSIGMEFVWIPPGEIAEIAQRVVVDNERIENGFWIGQSEITQGQWKSVMKTSIQEQCAKANINPNIKFFSEIIGEGENYPMYCVNWQDIQEFIKRLNEKDNSLNYELPTAKEWEYVAKDLEDWEYVTTNNGRVLNYKTKLEDVAWTPNNSGKNGVKTDIFIDDYGSTITFIGGGSNSRLLKNKQLFRINNEKNGIVGFTQIVGQKTPNRFGVFDIFGNVTEWVKLPKINGNSYVITKLNISKQAIKLEGESKEQLSSNLALICGGAWVKKDFSCSFEPSSSRVNYIGFRLIARPK